MADADVAIVGMAVLLPGAPNLERYEQNLVEGVDAIRPVPPGRLDPLFFDAEVDDPARFYCQRGGFVDDDADFDPLEFGIMPVVIEGAEPDQLIALRVASEALRDAGPGAQRVEREKIGVILGRGGYLTQAQSRLNEWVRTSEQIVACLAGLVPDLTPEQLAGVRQRFRQAIGAQRPEAVIGIVPNLAASRIANRLDLGGPAYLIDAACASSLLAVDHAVHELASGRCDLVLAGGVHHCHDTTLWSLFTQLRAVSPSQQIRPFDRRADGLLIGEGTGIVALRRLADAERDGDRIYAVIRGCGVASDGRASSLMNPRVGGQVLALERAYRAAQVDPDAIGLVEAHGTATLAGDEAELRTLAQFFGPPVKDRPRAGLGSVKSMIGHAMPAAGIAGLVKAALAVYSGMRLPTLHCEEPAELVRETRFWPVAKAEPWESPGAPRRAGVNAFGFGGVNAHVILESHGAAQPGARALRALREPLASELPEKAPRRAQRAGGERSQSEPLWLFAAADTAELLEQLDAAGARGGPAPLPRQPGPVRLAIANPDAKRLDAARSAVRRGRPWHGRSDLWFTPRGLLADGGRLALLFPGVEPQKPPALDDVAAQFELRAPDVQAADLEQQGFAIVDVARFLHGVLRRLGLQPDLAAGHSMGEWSGMIACEMVPPSAADAFIQSLERNRLEVPDVVYVAAGCSAEVAQQAIADLDGVALSHDNCPHQAIVCGRADRIALVRERLRERRVLSELLPFRSGFHSKFFEPYLERYRPAIERTPLQRPVLPLWSATTCEPYPDEPRAIHELVARFHVEPVRFRALTERLYAEGVRVFVQVGVGSLVHFVSDTLRAQPHAGVSLLEPGRSGLAQLRRAAAALFVEGAELGLERLFPATAAEAGPARRRLQLGSTLVRFTEPIALALRTGAEPEHALPEGALADELAAVLREAREAGLAVAERWAGEPAQTPRLLVRRERRERRLLSLERLPALLDHTLYPQPDAWPETSDLFPIAPMTAMVAWMAEAAGELVPELQVVAIESVQALRWLPVAPPTEVEIEARFDGVDRVQVTLDRYARCAVRLAGAYPTPPAGAIEPLAEPRPSPVGMLEFYRDRWMFHGPRYQGVAALGALGANGLDGVLHSLPAPGALLDSAGQLMGFWILLHTTEDRFAFPFQIEAIDFFGPEPAAGSRVECAVRIDSLGRSSARAHMDLCVGGRLWVRVRGWEDRRFETTERSRQVFNRPGEALLVEPGAQPYVVVRPHWRTAAGRDLLMRRYLGAEERAEYARVAPPAQSDWLLERIAAKDAVRRWLFERGASPVYPVQVRLRADEAGGLLASGPFSEDLRVATARQPGIAVALACVGRSAALEIGPRLENEEEDVIVRWTQHSAD